jgi:putative hemolysin
MTFVVPVVCLVLFTLLTLLFTTLNYALRDFSRIRLEEALAARDRKHYFDETIEHADDLRFMTATARLICNLCVAISFVALLDGTDYSPLARYMLALAASLLILLVFGLSLPYALAAHFAEPIIARFVGTLHWLWVFLAPAAKFVHNTEKWVGRAVPPESDESSREQLQQEVAETIKDVVSEAVESGAVDEKQRQLIDRAIAFNDATAEEAMTPRQDIVAISIASDLDTVRKTIHESGHSRVPVYEGDTVDHIVGMIYARDLLNLWNDHNDATFDLRKMLRTPLYVPPGKKLRDLMADFRMQKVHIAVVVDEHGGTAGLITIEDALEELVGDISDEYEPTEAPMYVRHDDRTAFADARIELTELNRLLGLGLPEDADYTTLGGFVSTSLGRIPERGALLETHGAKFTVLESEPTRVLRVRIELLAAQEA